MQYGNNALPMHPARQTVHHVTAHPSSTHGRMPTRPDLDADRALIEAVIAGDPDAIDRFVRQYARFIYWSACRDTRLGHHDADDVTQRVFVKLLEDDCRRLRLWHGTAFEPFLRQVVHNEALSFARGQFRPDHDPFPDNDAERDGAIAGLPPAGDDPEADALLAEVRNFIAHSTPYWA
jgi:DNA-directed RNA polymerase specialized sigma24 family protein